MGISIGIGGSGGGGGTGKVKQKVVDVLPETGIKGIIYLTRNSYSEGDNIYTEYLWIDNKWEKFGEINPTEYYTKDEVEALVDEAKIDWEDAQ